MKEDINANGVYASCEICLDIILVYVLE